MNFKRVVTLSYVYSVAKDNSSFSSDHFENEMENATLTTRDVLEQLFDNDSEFLGLILVRKRVKRSMLIVVRVSALQLRNKTWAWTRQTHVSASSTKALHIHRTLDRLIQVLGSSGSIFCRFLVDITF